MICWRVVGLDPAARPDEAGGMLWFPRTQQGQGRHDNPDLYGCLYVSAVPEGAIAETLAPFRGSGPLIPSMLVRGRRPLHLGRISLSDEASILDLDDPEVLAREGLRPSQVATRVRATTQTQAALLHQTHDAVAALRWWSTIESSLANLTIFDRAEPMLTLEDHRQLTLDDSEVAKAAHLLGLT